MILIDVKIKCKQTHFGVILTENRSRSRIEIEGKRLCVFFLYVMLNSFIYDLLMNFEVGCAVIENFRLKNEPRTILDGA